MPTTSTATTPSQTNPTPVPENKPHEHLSIGAVRAAIWANPSTQGVMFTATFQRRWKNAASGEWHTSTSFSRTELLQLAKLADRTHSRILILDNLERQAAQERQGGSSDPQEQSPDSQAVASAPAAASNHAPSPAKAARRASAAANNRTNVKGVKSR